MKITFEMENRDADRKTVRDLHFTMKSELATAREEITNSPAGFTWGRAAKSAELAQSKFAAAFLSYELTYGETPF